MIERLTQYVLFDHNVRWRNDGLSVVVGLFAYILCLLVDVPQQTALTVSFVALGLGMAVSTLNYGLNARIIATKRRARRRRGKAQINVSRRRLIPLLAGVAVIALVGIPLPWLEAAIVDKRLRLVLEGGPTATKMKEATQIIREAQKHDVHASPKLISTVGRQILHRASEDPQMQGPAWDAAQAFLDYLSFLNANRAPSPKQLVPYPGPHVNWHYDIGFDVVPGKPVHGRLWASKPVPADNAAVMETMGHNANVGQRFGPEFLIVDGLSVTVDGYRLKNVIFRNGTISYRAGHVIMENVYFVNCTFDIDPSATSFADVYLQSAPSISFVA